MEESQGNSVYCQVVVKVTHFNMHFLFCFTRGKISGKYDKRLQKIPCIQDTYAYLCLHVQMSSFASNTQNVSKATTQKTAWYRLQKDISHLMTKPTYWHVRPAKTLISLGIRPVWSESSLYAQWIAKDSEDSDQTYIFAFPFLISFKCDGTTKFSQWFLPREYYENKLLAK